MKIIYLHQYFNTPSMYGSTRSYEMGLRLAKKGHEVHIVTTDRKGKVTKKGWKTTDEAGMSVHWYPVSYSNKMEFRERVNAFIKFACVSALKASDLKGDVVFATSTPLTIALPGIYTKWIKQIPLVFEVRDLWPELPIAIGALQNKALITLAKGLEKVTYRQSAEIVALSPGMEEGIIKTGCTKNNVHVIPNSSDIDFFNVSSRHGEKFRKSNKWLQDRPLVIYAGTFGAINDVSYLVDLAANLIKKDPEIRLLAVGRGQEWEKVKDYAIDLGVYRKNFYMMESIAKKKMPSVLSAADIATSLFIDLKEMWANSANKFFDAFASGTPIAINYGGWQANLLQEENAGLVLQPDKIEQASDKLIKKIRDEKWLKRAGANAHKIAIEQFSRDKLAEQLEDVLKKAVEHNA